jgi:hypothetical protein
MFCTVLYTVSWCLPVAVEGTAKLAKSFETEGLDVVTVSLLCALDLAP